MIADSDSLVRKSMSGEGTKKARLVRLVLEDPFLTVEEMARRIDTTPRYVRTALSEARLSLVALRRRHGTKRALDGPSSEVGSGHPDADVRMAQVVDGEIAAMLQAPVDAALLEIRRLRVRDGEPLAVDRLVTTGRVFVEASLFSSGQSLVAALGLEEDQSVRFDERVFELLWDEPSLARILRIPADGPVGRAGGVLKAGDDPVAVKFTYFDGRRVRIVVGDGPGSAWRVVRRPGMLPDGGKGRPRTAPPASNGASASDEKGDRCTPEG